MFGRAGVRKIAALRSLIGIFGVAASAIAAPVASAGEFGSREDAVAMVHRVQKMFKTAGPEATFEAIRRKPKEFFDRDLYAYVIDLKGVVHANGAVPAVQGKNIFDFRDQNGDYLVRDEIEICKDPGHGWVDFRWLNPVTKVVEDKSAYLERMGDYCAGVGVYRTEQVNQNTVSIISGSPSSDDTSLQIAYDLAAVLNDGDNLRILPVVGIGGPRNIRDVRALKGIDLGLTQTSILTNFRGSNEQLGSFDNKIVYVAKLFNEEMHVVARSDITSLQQLQGQKVNLDEKSSGTSYSTRDLLRRLNLRVEEVRMTQADAFVKLKRGEIAATILIAGKPARSMTTLADGLHFLAVPYSVAMGDDYLPATLSDADYPRSIPAGQSVETVAVGAVLIAYNWPKSSDRYRRVEKFVNAFFPKIMEFRDPPRHVKWREVNLAAKLPGWSRFEPAETWLNNNLPAQASSGGDEQSLFQAFLGSRGAAAADPAANEQLFREFLKWRAGQRDR
jgi:TRAP-type uncharacterized transport system substrate-binding protein